MRLVITKDYAEMAEWAARYIKKRINDFKAGPNRLFVLGLPTGARRVVQQCYDENINFSSSSRLGSTPLGTYRKLIEFVKAKEVSFKYVVTFNMDEYVGLPRVNNRRSTSPHQCR